MIAGMKTAISVDDALMEEADAVARHLGLSRSRLISDALRDYLRQRRAAQITQQLNQVYATTPDAHDRRLGRKLKAKLPIQDQW
jgi:metal-responsive CopG/Arc/MetJ family transcriptional regulator